LHALGASWFAVLFAAFSFYTAKIYSYVLHQGEWQFDLNQVTMIITTSIIVFFLLLVFLANIDNTRAQVISLHNYMLVKFFAQVSSGDSNASG